MRYKYVDIHTHLNINAFFDDWQDTGKRTLNEGVAMINVGTELDTSKRAIEITEYFEDGAYATIGLHPTHTCASHHDPQEFGEDKKEFTKTGEELDLTKYEEMARHEKVVAIGECGLDYFRLTPESKEKQKEAFIEQIRFANKIGKPLMLHVRASEGLQDAYEDALDILKAHAVVKGNVHFFVGSLYVARGFWDLGFTTSFTGVITFTHDYDDVVKNAPLEMIHAETDAPYAAPVPYRGKRNEPLYVREVYKKIAELRGEEETMVRLQLLKNASRIFDI